MQRHANDEAVVLIHGLFLSGWSMALIARRLRRRGLRSYVFSYPSTRNTLRASALALRAFSDQIEGSTIHFVGHSLGGVVICAMLYYAPPPRPGRVVTLASPHSGAHVARLLSRRAWCRRILGPGVADLLANEPPRDLPAREVGLVKGDLPIGLGRLFPRLKYPNDGLLSFEDVCLPGAADEITLRVSHTAMLLSPGVCRRIGEFLEDGRFQRR